LLARFTSSEILSQKDRGLGLFDQTSLEPSGIVLSTGYGTFIAKPMLEVHMVARNKQSKPTLYWLTLAAIIAALAFGAAAQASESQLRFLCSGLFGDEDILILEKGEEDSALVTVTLHDIAYTARYARNGLEHRWLIDGNDNFQIIIDPDLSAGYYDFSNEKEDVRPMTYFSCRIEGGSP
jgi:hypothetical protein